MMKRFPLFIAIAVSLVVAACSLDKDNDQESIENWRKLNGEWYDAQAALKNPDGTPYYQKVVPSWNPSAQVLMHWFNDRSLTAENLTPMETSTVDVKYILRNYKGEPMDSSYRLIANGDSIFRTKVTGVIPGWQIALQNMKVGDSVRLVIPYAQGYGISGNGSVKPYSTLQFDIKLVDISSYEIR